METPSPESGGELARVRAELARERRRVQALGAEVFALRAGLKDVRDDLERVARSRTWRWSHGVAVMTTRLRRGRPITRGGISRALERIGRLERLRPDAAGKPGDGPAIAPPARAAARERALRVAIAVAAPSREAAARGGDVHFAEAIAAELRRRGHAPAVHALPEWESLDPLDADVALVLRGRNRYAPGEGAFSVLWNISHPAELTGEECEAYDLVCTASSAFARRLEATTATPVMVLEQATDPAVFHPEPDLAAAHEIVFVGNSRGVRRKVLDDLLPTDRDLAVFGSGWDGVIPRRYLRGEHVPNRELRRIYSSAGVVLNDHWDDMRAHGFVSNRLYDAVACGAVVVSDHVDGVEERFAGAVLTYRTRDELHALVEQLLASPDERAERGAAGREAVRARHTFAHRVDALLEAVFTRIR